MMTEQRRTYTVDLKRAAVRLAAEQDHSMSQATRTLSINVNMSGRWKSQVEGQQK